MSRYHRDNPEEPISHDHFAGHYVGVDPAAGEDETVIQTYVEKKLNSMVRFSKQDMIDSIKRLEWLTYEVDPEWARFCSFGPEDIGGPWEQLGVIRKRPIFNMIALDKHTLKAIDAINRDYFDSSRPISPLYGMNIVESPIGNYMIRSDLDFKISSPARCIKLDHI